MSAKGTPIPRKLSVDEISFSAHVDYSQNSEFIEMVKAQHIVCPPFTQSLKPAHGGVLGPRTRRADRNGPVACCDDRSVQEPGRGRQDTHASQPRDS